MQNVLSWGWAGEVGGWGEAAALAGRELVVERAGGRGWLDR